MEWSEKKKEGWAKKMTNIDSTGVLIGLQVFFHCTMKNENDLSNIVVRIYSFMKEI